jgi:hypothetical protein
VGAWKLRSTRAQESAESAESALRLEIGALGSPAAFLAPRIARTRAQPGLHTEPTRPEVHCRDSGG